MPTYEYKCDKCGQSFDFFQSIKDDPIAACPKEKCGQKKWGKGRVRRMIGAGAGLIFKGSGFYITDYRSENYKESAKKDSGESKPAAPKTESKSPPAPAKAKEPKPEKKS